MNNTNPKEIDIMKATATISVSNGKEVTISVEEYTRLKDIQTRFEILKNQMIHADYCPIHTQIVLGIENEYKKKEIELIPVK